MIRRVGIGGLTLLLGSAALALGVLSIAGPVSEVQEWDPPGPTLSPIALEPPAPMLPALGAGEAIFLARPAKIAVETPGVASIEDPGLRRVVVESPVPTLPEIHLTRPGELASVSRVPIRPPGFQRERYDLGQVIIAVALDPRAAVLDIPYRPTLPAIATTRPGELASVSRVRVQPPTGHREYRFAESLATVTLRPVEAGLPEVPRSAPTRGLCLGDCMPDLPRETCDGSVGAT